MKLPNIKYKGDISKFVEAEDNSYENIMFYKDRDFFMDDVEYSRFVKSCEVMFRSSKEYKAFESYIKAILGIDYCQVSSRIYGSDNVKIELHHGPLFTLYDITSIILNWMLKRGNKITSFRVVNKVIEEHFALRVQVVMLTTTNHEAVHNRDLFLNFNQGIGNANEFIHLYGDCLDDEQKYKIWNYINLCKSNPSFDNGILDIDGIKKYIEL